MKDVWIPWISDVGLILQAQATWNLPKPDTGDEEDTFGNSQTRTERFLKTQVELQLLYSTYCTYW